jgi:Ca-activated chloride channel homolog
MHIKRVTFCGVLAVFALWTGGEEPIKIRTDVNLVQLQARVTDSGGRTISGLGKDTFQLFVDDAPQPITVFQAEDAPVTAGIVVDNSASMTPKRDQVIAAALAFARTSKSQGPDVHPTF